MRQHRPLQTSIASAILRMQRGGNRVSVLGLLCLIFALAGCFNRPQTDANAPSLSSPTPTSPANSSNPIPSSPTIASPTGTPQPSSSPQTGNKSNAIKDIESRLSKNISAATGISIQSINCPAGTEVKVSNRFDCTATSDGQSFAVAVEITNATNTQFQWSTKGLLVLSKLEQFIQQQIKDKNGLNTAADCGGSIRVANPGDTFECKVSDPQGQARSAKVTVKDEQGNVDVALI